APTAPAQAITLAVVSVQKWTEIPARLSADRKILALNFAAQISGDFTLHFEDDGGLRGSRIIQVRVRPDPAPSVQLKRPSHGQDSLEAVPGAELPIEVEVDDPIFAVRSSHLEYHVRRNGKEVQTGRLPLYDHMTLAQAASELLHAL